MRHHKEDATIISTKKQLEAHLSKARVLDSSRPFLRALGNVGHGDSEPVKAPNQERDVSAAIKVESVINVSMSDMDDGGRCDIAILPIDCLNKLQDGTASAQESWVEDSYGTLIYGADTKWDRSQLVTIMKCQGGETPWTNETSSFDGSYQGFSLLDGFNEGTSHIPKGCKAAIVAMTVEVKNTTPALYKGGSVYSYSMGGTELLGTEQLRDFNDSTGALGDSNPVNVYFAPASTLDQVGLISDASRLAEEGALIPGFSNRDGAYTPVAPSHNLYLVQDGTNKNYVGPHGYNAGASGAVSPVPASFVTGLNTSVACFFGLSSQTTFSIKIVVHLELIVPPYNSLFPFCTPMAPYDPQAMELMSQLYQDLLSSYPADWNGFGDFLKHVVSKIRDFVSKAAPVAAKVATVLGEPEIAAIVRRVGVAAARKPSPPKPKPKK
jgi:hypothetical protein